MAITNAQQYQQLVNKPANGKRPGYRGPGGYQGGASSRGGPPGGGATAGGSGRDFSGGGGGGGRQDRDSQYTGGGYDSSKNVSGRTAADYANTGTTTTTPVKKPIKKPKKTKDNFKKPNIIESYFENNLFTKGLRALKNSRLAQLNSQKQRENYLNNLQITNPELYQETIDDLEKLGYYNPDPVEYYGPESKGAARDIEQFPDLYEDQAGSILNTVRDNFDDEGTATVGTLYDDYLDSLNTPTGGGGGDNQVMDPCKGPNPPAYCFVGDNTTEEVVPDRNLGGLAPRFMGSSFDFTGLAEGGRVAAQQGGIMPRLSDLSGDVSSAEQMLQEINQRLESAESTLGEGGGGGMFGAGNFGPGFNTNFNQQPLSPIAGSIQNQRQNSLNLPSALADPIRIRPSYEDALSDYNQRMESGMMTNDIERNKMRSRENYDSYNKQQDPAIINQRFQDQLQDYTNRFGQRSLMADGGRMRQMEMMQDEDDPTGGIMDLESGRQMYFLGKLVKKAGRAIKKVVKSPIGKAALLYFGGNALMSGGGGGLSSLFNSGKGLKLKEMFMGSVKPGGKGNRIGGLFNFMKDNPYLSILGGSTALAGLSGKDKDEDGPIDYGPGIDIDRLRYAPYRTLAPSIIGSNYQTGTEGRKDGGRMGYQEGGDAEPVAKKTMPLLDMDGQEMDLRAEGGFVPLGRMERADDVPARLSKNEFVFTADAVRNAGEGDIDKGAEVMYNMMKNLESGGEVSEESQGLDGAKEMFQTSQRLEEVL